MGEESRGREMKRRVDKERRPGGKARGNEFRNKEGEGERRENG